MRTTYIILLLVLSTVLAPRALYGQLQPISSKELRLGYVSPTTNYISLQAPAVTTNYTLLLPATTGSNGQVLITNGSGTLSWSDPVGFPYIYQGSNFTNSMILGQGTTGTRANNLTANTGLGIGALASLTGSASAIHGTLNTALGYNALNVLTRGYYNTMVGAYAGESMSDASNVHFSNTAIGAEAMRDVGAFASSSNVAIGVSALRKGAQAAGTLQNVAVGWNALGELTGGINNIALGRSAGTSTASGANASANGSIFIGRDTKASASGNSNEIVIGDDATGLGSNTILLGNSSIVTTALRGNVLINNSGSSAGQVRFLEGSAGTDYVAIQSPASLAAPYTLTLPTDDGDANQVLTTNGSGVMSWSTINGLQYFTEVLHTASPNNTVNAVQWKPATGTNVDVVISPLGTGALMAQVPDGAEAGGNKRGANAVDWQMSREDPEHVASGSSSVIAGGAGNRSTAYVSTVGGGETNAATEQGATVSGGISNVASGQYSTVSGGNAGTVGGNYATIGGGRNNRVDGAFSTVLGGSSLTLTGRGSIGFNAANSATDPTNSMSVSADGTMVLGNANLWLANNDNTARELRFYEAQSTTGAFPAAGTNYTAFKAGAQSADITYTLPTAAPTTAGQVLSSTTGGVMSWVTPSTGWALTGNAGTDSTINFLGTTDARPLVVKTAGTERMRIDGGGVLSTAGDAVINGIRIGRGNGDINTNTVVGHFAATTLAAGDNTVVGFYASEELTNGTRNVVLGYEAGNNVIDHSDGIFIGANSGSNGITATTNEIVIGSTANGLGSNTVVLGNSSIVTTALRGNVLINNSGTSAGQVRFLEGSSGTDYVAIQSPASLAAPYTLTLPANDGNANQVLATDGSGVMSWSTINGLQYFTEVLHTASPNNTVNAVQWKPATGTNVDVVISPLGSGALMARVPDGALAGGNKRGTFAVDWQLSRGDAEQVASGTSSTISGGGSNMASGAYSVVSGGLENQATGERSLVSGGYYNWATAYASSVLGGIENQAQGLYSTVLGGQYLTLLGSNSAGYNGGGNRLSVADTNTFVLGNVNLWLANNDNTARELRFYEAQSTTGAFPAAGTNYTAFKAGAQSADITYTLPTAAPTTNGQVLSSTTGGEMSWETAATLSSTGTTNRLSKFTSATGLGDSRISDDGTDITVGVGQTAGAINIGSALTTGTVSIGGTSQTGLVAVGNGTSATQQIIEIGRYGNKAIQIGSESNANNEINIISRKATTFYGPEIAFRANTSGTTTAPELRLHEDYPGVGITPEHIGLKAPAVLSASQVYTLPANAPTVNGQVLSSTTAGVMSWQTGLTATSGWTTAGNAGTTASNYLGTSDAQPLSIRTGGVQRIGVDADGTVRVTGTTNLGPLNVSGETYFPSSNAVIFSGSGAKLFSSGDVSFSTSGAINFSGGGAKTFNNGSVDFNLGSDLQFRGNGNKTFSLGNIIFSTTGSMTVSGPLLDITSAGGLRVASNSVAQVLSRMGVGLAPTSNTGDAQLQVTAAASANRGLTITGAASQTANLLELRNSAGTALLSADNNGTLTLNPFGASAGNTNELRFAELAVNGTNYVGFKAADNITSNLVYTLPTTAPTAGQVLSSAADGTMSWVTPSTGWSLTGNAGTSPSATLGNTAVGNFIGTTDGVSLSFVTSNIVRMRIDANGNPFTQLDMSINGVMVGKGGGSISRNVRVGSGALNATATGNDNTAVGNNALNANVGGQDNSALGESALESNTGGNANTAVGQDALRANTTGGSNVAIGASSLDASNNSFNVAVGHSALGAQNGGDGNNTAVGAAAMMFNLTGAYNAAFGLNAFRELTSGNNNVAIGHAAGMLLAGNTGNLTTATNSIFIGNGTKANANGETNQIVIGTGAEGIGSNTVVLGSSTILTTALRGNVGIGTTAPAGTLHAVNTSATTNAVVDVARLDVQSSGTPAVGIGTGLEFATETAANNTEVGAIIEAVTTDVTATTEDFDLVFKTMAGGAAAAERMRIESNGDVTATAFFETSDARLKEVIRRDGNVVYFKWKDRRDDRIHIGYLAQEVQETHPDQVNTDANGVMSVHYIELLIEKIRQLEKRIEDLESQKK